MPKDVRLSPTAHLAVLAVDEGESGVDLLRVAEAGGAFDFLNEEPDLYSDADVLTGRRNPGFGQPR